MELRSSDFAQRVDAGGDMPIGYYTDEELEAMDIPLYSEGTVAGQASSCQTIGAFNAVFTSDVPRFRGNFYRIEFTDVVLHEIRQQLRITLNTALTLRFSAHRAPSADVDDPDIDALFERVRPDVTVNVAGTGTVVTYPSGPITPLLLEAGFDYMIGVSWPATTGQIAFGRDILGLPRPFLHGTVIGNANIQTAPLLDEHTMSEANIVTAGAYAMELCFTAVEGACCNTGADPAACDDTLLESQCTAAGSFFFGERSTCAEFGGNCVFGACCGPCGDDGCENNVALPACEEDGGVWAGEGLMCTPGLCTPITGACCTGATCTEMCEKDCLEDDPTNVYLGDGTTCFPNMCAGACCLSGTTFQGCLNLTSAVCNIASGTFKGLGTTCASLTPAQECGGACCDLILSCLSVSRRADCTAATGLNSPVYRGDARTCGGTGGVDCADGAETGACCFPNGTCFITSREACQDGSFTPGATSCTQVQCDTVCCVPDQACRITPGAAACTDPTVGGFVLDGRTTCVPDFCGKPTGACCFADAGLCTGDITFDECRNLGGRFVDGIDCLDCPVLGACCRPNGSCSDPVTADECMILTGEEGGLIAGEDCPPPGECEALGACCTGEGGCTLELESDCETAGGFFAGADTACGPTSCPTGACCGGEVCEERIEAACIGDFRGEGTACDDPEVLQCAGPGACCFDVDLCFALEPSECVSNEARFQGEGVACEGEVCAAAACCLPEDECRDTLFPLECEAAGGFSVIGETCAQDACEVRGACCLPDGECLDSIRQSECEADEGAFTPEAACDEIECEAVGACCRRDGTCQNDVPESLCVGNDLFTPVVDCDELDPPCERRGSCCFRDGTCDDLVRESECLAANPASGAFSFRNTCAIRDCPVIGACCFRNGVCENNRSAEGCAAGNGEHFVDTDCAQITCVPVGACCVIDIDLLVCLPDRTQTECTIEDGVFQGPESECPTGGAPCGACCRFNGNCGNHFIPARCAAEPGVFESGLLCTELEFACEGRGACCTNKEGCVEEVTENECNDLGGSYDGDGSTCRPDLCDEGACCLPAGICEDMVTRQECERVFEGGIYVGADLTCEDDIDCTRGSCCFASGECIDNTVVSECDAPEDFRTESCFGAPCEGRGACCVAGACQPGLTEAECDDAMGVYAGDGSLCEPEDLCTPGGCCHNDGTCTDTDGRLECENAGGTFRGAGLTCPAACNLIDSTDPPDCAIDARQPFDPDGSNENGWDRIEITFEDDLVSAIPEDFTAETFPGIVSAPNVAEVLTTADPATVIVVLDDFIPVGEWTCINHLPSASRVCFGNLPGDVDGNRTAEPQDAEAVLDCITEETPCEPWQCDADHSGACRPQDGPRVIDLLNRSEQYGNLPFELPESCPTFNP